MNTYAEFLATGAGCADNADIAATHCVTKTQRRTVNNGGSAVRPHHQQPFFVRQLFQRQLIVEGHVVRKQHHVEVILQRLTRFTGREQAVDRNHRQVTVGNVLLRTGKRGIACFVLAALLLVREQLIDSHQRLRVRRLARTLDDNHQIATLRLFQFRRQQAEILQNAFVHFRCHRHERLLHAIELVSAR
ncbi:hypothetical protein D3C73_886170 [compost metagenome]